MAIVLGCWDGIEPGDVMPGDYVLRFVDFATTPIQPVPATSVSMSDTTVVEHGALALEESGRCVLELVYRWRYEGIPGGATILDTLSYVFELRGDFFGTAPLTDYYRLLRGPDHIGYLARVGGETLVLLDYDLAGTMHFYFQR
jgi:hypothetical protein